MIMLWCRWHEPVMIFRQTKPLTHHVVCCYDKEIRNRCRWNMGSPASRFSVCTTQDMPLCSTLACGRTANQRYLFEKAIETPLPTSSHQPQWSQTSQQDTPVQLQNHFAYNMRFAHGPWAPLSKISSRILKPLWPFQHDGTRLPAVSLRGFIENGTASQTCYDWLNNLSPTSLRHTKLQLAHTFERSAKSALYFFPSIYMKLVNNHYDLWVWLVLPNPSRQMKHQHLKF